MGRALYRKYRSKSLDEVVGQEHVTTTLANALKSGKISHAYLLAGPRGVGKTSIARILAHEINGLPYDEDTTHLDIIEIDAASNRRIDEIRDLREKIHSAPTAAKYKVYIIDEVHMLTKEAFNALLKTLEEPPAHAIFILATTEEHKLPPTIVSRTQRFIFKPVPESLVVQHLKNIAKQEKIDITDEALAKIAAFGEGSFRDSISLLDQVRNHADKIDETHVLAAIGLANQESLENILQTIAQGQAKQLTSILSGLAEQGMQPEQLAKQLSKLLRQKLASGDYSRESALNLLKELVMVPASHDPGTLLEIVLLEAALKNDENPDSQPAAAKKPDSPPPAEPSPAKLSPKVSEGKPAKPEKIADIKKPEPSPTKLSEKVSEGKPPKESKPAKSGLVDKAVWQQALEQLRGKHNTLYSLAKSSRAEFSGNTITLYCRFAFHKKQLTEDKNKRILLGVLHDLSGQTVDLICEIDETPAGNADTHKASTGSALPDSISNIFGAAEVLES